MPEVHTLIRRQAEELAKTLGQMKYVLQGTQGMSGLDIYF